MPKKRSAGILLYRVQADEAYVLLAHPGGPFWSGKDLGAWTIPKGEFNTGEESLGVALREFAEEIGFEPPGPYLPLGEVDTRGKIVTVWAAKGDFDPSRLSSNLCEIEWPPRSGRKQLIPEIDRAEWFSVREARAKLLAAQVPFLDRLIDLLSAAGYALGATR
jgi:predicted NUDIX family NTP pyrophosphohydrolase